MSASHIRFDTHAIGAIMRGAASKVMVDGAAELIATKVRDQHIQVGAFAGGVGPIDLPVTVSPSTTDRASAFVVLAHPAGLAAQAKYGVLGKAAAAAGFLVRGED